MNSSVLHKNMHEKNRLMRRPTFLIGIKGGKGLMNTNTTTVFITVHLALITNICITRDISELR